MSEEQTNYFHSWHEFLEASCGQKIAVLEPRDILPESGPWMRMPRQWDTLYFMVDGHEIAGSGLYAEGPDRIKIEGSGDSRWMQDAAWVADDGVGIFLTFDPRTVRYVNCVEGEDRRPNPAWLLLRNVEKFFKEWDVNGDDRFFRVFRTIKEERLAWLKTQVDYNIRDIARHKLSLDRMQKELIRNRSAMVNLRAMTKEKYEEATKNWKSVAQSMGKIYIPRDAAGKPRGLFMEMPAFEINDVKLGPYKIKLDLAELELSVENIGDNKSHEGHHHPHVSTDEDICWGDNPRMIVDVINRGNPFEILFCVADFLKTSYNPNGAYCRLDEWEGEDSDRWWCDFCEDHHRDGDDCPNYCGECENHVHDWDEHHTCFEHYRCWNEDDLSREHREDDREECPDCRRDRLRQEEEGRDTDEDEGEDEGEDEDDGERSTVVGVARPDGYTEDCQCADCITYREAAAS